MSRIILIVLAVLTYSCGGNTGMKQIDSPNKTREIRIVSSPDSMITKISEIAADIEYIPLQPSVNTPILAIERIITRGNKIYINLVNDILCFDDRGNFLYQLYGIGKDKGESVVAIYDFDIDNADTSLIVMCGNELLLFKNSGSGFDYTKTIKLGRIFPSKVAFIPETNKVLLSAPRIRGNEPSLSVLINLDEEILSNKQYFFNRFNSIQYRLYDEFIHYQFENKLYFKERFNDTVFSINIQSNKFIPGLILFSGLSNTNSEKLKNPDFFRALPNVVNIFEVPRYLYFSYPFYTDEHDKVFYYKVFYDKYENRRYEIDPWSGVLKDDIGGGPDFESKYFSEGKMYSWISARDLKKYIGSENFTKAEAQNLKKQKDLKKLAVSLNDPDNPVLIVVTPRK